MPDETQPQITKRVDPSPTPTHPEHVWGNIVKETGWEYQRVHLDDVDSAMNPKVLQPTGVMFPGWQICHGQPTFRQATEGKSKDTVARDRDTVWMRCRSEDHAKIIHNDRVKSDNAAERIGAGERENAEGVSMKTNVRTEG